MDRSASKLICEETEYVGNCTMASPEDTSIGKRTSSSSNDRDGSKKSSSRQSSKRKKKSMAAKEKDHRTSTHRPGTTRKACVSGLSVSRWKSRDAFTNAIGPRGGTKTMDCSINELIPSQHRRPMKLTDISKDFCTPVKGHNLSLSSLLAEITPNTHTWSRLKAALSVHRKVILTPKTPGPGMPLKIAMADLSQDLFATPHRTPLLKRRRSQESQDEMSDAEKVYAECGQQGPVAWDECLLPQRMKQCVKIGEGTFGEVFSTTSGKPDGEIVALKVIPVEGSEKVNGEGQKTFGEILHEIIISKELSCLDKKEKNQTSGFIGLRDLHCVKGCYPPEFLNAWDKFDKQKGSENDRPDFFENEQLFIILEFEFGGTDLENSDGTLSSITVAKSILHQVTAALAVAEQELQFEHRDLHWGNVLVKVTKDKTAEFSLNGTVHSLETKGVLVRIIDYSLSRLEIDELTVSCDISNDEELFMGQGDYQFEIYRLMRQENSNEWSSYNPHSNVLWLHYLCSKLLDMKYRGRAGRRNKDMRAELACFYDNVLQFSSATEVLQNSPLFQ
ncbi:serine/threonine-protein kinase haspin isoform X2 [Boleophthalmus pectinirostris]|uniref:serine/threonine-protein kinase haspin isoform X2 n=1 Tax=Boleophthalmus pectinirostris TaxID=150288 RepID=UPI00243056FA|nr:serine/threonine-protein kinase haspin isoform X2 [Boleophthalmus pectinirostris]